MNKDSGKLLRIGVLLDSQAIPDQRHLFRGMWKWLQQHPDRHWQVFYFPREELDTLRNAKCDGFIGSLGTPALYRLALRMSVPFVQVTHVDHAKGIPCVALDERACGRAAADHFIERGFQRFACVSRGAVGWNGKRLCGYADRLHEKGLPVAMLDITKIPGAGTCFNQPDVRRRIAHFIQAQPGPLAVFGADDFLAMEVAHACVAYDIPIPDEVALLGVNNNDVCELVHPPLSSMRQPNQEIGFKAAAVLDQLIREGSVPEMLTLIPPLPIITRRSSDRMLIDDEDVRHAVEYIQKRFSEQITVDDLARHTSLSRTSLYRRFAQCLGYNPYASIRKTRLHEARRLLVQTEIPVCEVAERCGFRSTASFTTAFGKSEGITPSVYRRRGGPIPGQSSMPRS